jgi:SAM-dependent methyltransferase
MHSDGRNMYAAAEQLRQAGGPQDGRVPLPEDGPDGRAISFVRSRPSLKSFLRGILNSIGYDTTDWVRVVMYRRCFAFVQGLQPGRLDVLEVSAGPHWRRAFAFKSYIGTDYPGYDICAEVLPGRYDLIIADQVFEHLRWPARAARHAFETLRPGGHLIVTVPFLLRVHKSPIDCSRWTEDGLSYLLQEAGFTPEMIYTDSWGNRACLKANLTRWRKRGFFGSLRNEPEFPVMVWAFARKPEQ